MPRISKNKGWRAAFPPRTERETTTALVVHSRQRMYAPSLFQTSLAELATEYKSNACGGGYRTDDYT